MNWFEKILYALEGKMNAPTPYSPFHLIFLALTVIATALACCYFYKSQNDKKLRRLVLICWIILVLLEVYKQLIYSFSYDKATGDASWDYQWYIFPFQLCASQLYLLPFVVFLKEGKVRDAVMAFLSTFSLFGGLAVMLYPGDVFTEVIGVNAHGMIHHAVQVVFGVSFMIYNRKKLNFNYFLGGVAVYAVMITIAQVLNLCGPLFIKDETFNMFFISPYFRCTLPVLSSIYPHVPYPVFFLLYLFGFIAIALGIFYLIKAILFAVERKTEKTEATKQTKGM